MADALEISVEDAAPQVVQPPVIDSLHRDKKRRIWSILFVPEPSVSRHEKERVTIGFNSAEGQRIQTRMDRLEKLFGRPIDRIYHGGGGDFTFHFLPGRGNGAAPRPRQPHRALRDY